MHTTVICLIWHTETITLKKRDTEQDEKLDAEIKRSKGVDSEQDKKMKDIETKLGEGSMYETDEE